jgi:hypothetical protein
MPRTASPKPITSTAGKEIDPLWRVYDQLVHMQTELAGRLANEFSGSDMALLASVTGALTGISAELARRR